MVRCMEGDIECASPVGNRGDALGAFLAPK